MKVLAFELNRSSRLKVRARQGIVTDGATKTASSAPRANLLIVTMSSPSFSKKQERRHRRTSQSRLESEVLRTP